MPDEIFLAWLWFNFRIKEPIWEDCSQEEYERYNNPANDHTISYKPSNAL